MQRNLRRILTLAVLVAFAAYFLLDLDKFRPLLHANFWLLIIIAAADFLSLAANGLFTKGILRPFGKNISTRESVYVSLIASVGNFFAPAGAGFAFRAAYLKRNFQMSYKDYVTTLYGNYILVFLINSFFGLLALYLLRSKHDSEFFVLVFIFAGIFCTSTLLSLVKIPSRILERDLRNEHINKLAKILFEMLDGWNKIISNREMMFKLISLVSFNFLLSILITKAEVSALHLTIKFPSLLLFSVLGSLSLFVSITPANLGVKEAIYLFSSTVIGFSVSQILSIALIDRGVLFIVLVLLWVSMGGKKILKSETAEEALQKVE